MEDISSTPDIMRIMRSRVTRQASRMARTADKINAPRILFGKHEGKRSLAIP